MWHYPLSLQECDIRRNRYGLEHRKVAAARVREFETAFHKWRNRREAVPNKPEGLVAIGLAQNVLHWYDVEEYTVGENLLKSFDLVEFLAFVLFSRIEANPYKLAVFVLLELSQFVYQHNNLAYTVRYTQRNMR
jgi:hypothetical protein